MARHNYSIFSGDPGRRRDQSGSGRHSTGNERIPRGGRVPTKAEVEKHDKAMRGR